jgi:hypothetical protein
MKEKWEVQHPRGGTSPVLLLLLFLLFFGFLEATYSAFEKTVAKGVILTHIWEFML